MGRKGGGRVQIKRGSQPSPMKNPLASLAIPPEEMIHLPPKQDSSISYPWPPRTQALDWSTFHMIYPTYLDSTKTAKNGRLIGKEASVAKPSVMEIAESLKILRMNHVVQPFKGYPRDTESRWDNLGRVLVDLKGVRMNGDENDFTNKKALIKAIAKVIPGLEIRKKRIAEEKRQEEERLRKQKEEIAAAKQKERERSIAASTNSKKKRGKKKK